MNSHIKPIHINVLGAQKALSAFDSAIQAAADAVRAAYAPRPSHGRQRHD